MADQATVDRGADSPRDGMLGGIGGLGMDVAALAALQMRLAASDLRESIRRLLPAVIALAAVATLALGCVMVGCLALASWIESAWGFSHAASLGLTAVGGLAVCAATAFITARLARDGFGSFQRSREEFERNLAWLGTVLKQSGR